MEYESSLGGPQFMVGSLNMGGINNSVVNRNNRQRPSRTPQILQQLDHW